MKKTYKKIEEKLTSEGTELRQPVAELEAPATERKQTEQPLRESEERYRRLVELSPDAIAVHSEGKIVFANPAVAKLLGAAVPEELIGKPVTDFLHPDYKEIVKQRIQQAAEEGGQAPFIEEKFVRLDGTDVDVEVTAIPITYLGKPAVQAIARDITERKQAEEALRESEEKYRTIFENVNDVVVRLDKRGKIIDANKRVEDYFGYKPDEIIGKNFAKLGALSLKDLPKIVKLFGERVKGKPLTFIELEVKRKDGSTAHLEANTTLVKKDSKIEGTIAIIRDITERKQTENELRKFKTISDKAGYGITIVDLEGNVSYVNTSFSKMHGYTPDELIGKHLSIFHTEQQMANVNRLIEQLKREGSFVAEELGHKRKDNTEFITLMNGTLVKDENGTPLFMAGTAADIIERKRMEEELRESEEKLRKMFESVIEGISVINLNGVITEVNQRTVEMHGFSSKDELLGKSAFELVAPRDHEKIAKNMRKTLKERLIRGVEYTLLKSDGSEFPGELSTSVLKDASGNPVGHVTIARDITERKQAEEREKELQQELHLSSRLASIGELAAGVAHQLNNPLTGVLGFSQRLLRKSADQEVSQDLRRIYTEAERAAKVVQNLLAFARRRQPHKQYSDINDILESALELRAYELETSNIEVITHLTHNLPQVMLDFQQIQEVFLNIILNAEQVMTEAHSGGRLTIKTGERKGYIRTTFTDDGPGIPAEHLDKLFDPFFSTRGERGGTGLGLSVCHGIITEHGGRIYAKSKPGKGATFFVELPVSTDVVET